MREAALLYLIVGETLALGTLFLLGYAKIEHLTGWVVVVTTIVIVVAWPMFLLSIAAAHRGPRR